MTADLQVCKMKKNQWKYLNFECAAFVFLKFPDVYQFKGFGGRCYIFQLLLLLLQINQVWGSKYLKQFDSQFLETTGSTPYREIKKNKKTKLKMMETTWSKKTSKIQLILFHPDNNRSLCSGLYSYMNQLLKTDEILLVKAVIVRLNNGAMLKEKIWKRCESVRKFVFLKSFQSSGLMSAVTPCLS